jgi:hypothetical protein
MRKSFTPPSIETKLITVDDFSGVDCPTVQQRLHTVNGILSELILMTRGAMNEDEGLHETELAKTEAFMAILRRVSIAHDELYWVLRAEGALKSIGAPDDDQRELALRGER